MTKKQFIIDLIATYLSSLISGIAGGMLIVLISVKMKYHVGDEILISIAFFSQIVGGIILARYLMPIIKIINPFNKFYLANIVTFVLMILMHEYYGYASWLLIIFIFGGALFSFDNIRQTMIFEVSPEKNKALVSAVGRLMLVLGLAYGSYTVKYIGFTGLKPYLIAASIQLCSIIPIFFVKGITICVKQAKKISFSRYIINSPKIMMASVCANYVFATSNMFIVIYGLQIGLSASQSATLLTALLLGNLLALPIGALSDIVNRRFITIFCTVTSLTFAYTLYSIPMINNNVIHVLLFLIFGSVVGIRLPSLILINEKYKSTQRVAVNIVFNKMGTIGNILGVLITGIFMKYYGPQGLWISIMFGIITYFIFTIANYSYQLFQGKQILGNFLVQHK